MPHHLYRDTFGHAAMLLARSAQRGGLVKDLTARVRWMVAHTHKACPRKASTSVPNNTIVRNARLLNIRQRFSGPTVDPADEDAAMSAWRLNGNSKLSQMRREARLTTLGDELKVFTRRSPLKLSTHHQDSLVRAWERPEARSVDHALFGCFFFVSYPTNDNLTRILAGFPGRR